MKQRTNRGVVALTVVCAIVVTAWACQSQGQGATPTPAPKKPSSSTARPAAVEAVDIQIDPATMGFAKERVRRVKVKRGNGVKYTARNSDIWILFPSSHIKMVEGGSSWAIEGDIVSVKIPEGKSATIMIDPNFPYPDEDQELGYSILSMKNKQWRYVLGSSPPRIIIPKR